MGAQPNDIESDLDLFTGLGQPSPQLSGTGSLAAARWAGALRLVGVVALLLVVWVGVGAYFELRDGEDPLTLIVGDDFPTVLVVVLPALAIGMTAIVGAAFIRQPRSKRRGKWVLNIVAAAFIVLVAASMPTTLMVSGAQLVARGEYNVLPEQSGGGCRIVVTEHRSLLYGNGRVGIVQPNSVVVQWVRSYWADDGQTPFTPGDFTFEWAGRTADLDIYGNGTDPVGWTTDGPLVCDE